MNLSWIYLYQKIQNKNIDKVIKCHRFTKESKKNKQNANRFESDKCQNVENIK